MCLTVVGRLVALDGRVLIQLLSFRVVDSATSPPPRSKFMTMETG